MRGVETRCTASLHRPTSQIRHRRTPQYFKEFGRKKGLGNLGDFLTLLNLLKIKHELLTPRQRIDITPYFSPFHKPYFVVLSCMNTA